MYSKIYKHKSDNKQEDTCVQCERKGNINFYCTDCRTQLCGICQRTHLYFPALQSHRIVPMTNTNRDCVALYNDKDKRGPSSESDVLSNSQQVTGIVSYRHINKPLKDLMSQTKNKTTSFQLKRDCMRFCWYDDFIWCPCHQDNTIDVYNISGDLYKSIRCDRIQSPNALHPFTFEFMLIACDSGLYLFNIQKENTGERLMKGCFRDVHIIDDKIVALQERGPLGDVINVLNTTNPPSLLHSFQLNHSDSLRILLFQNHIYVSAYEESLSIQVYSLSGDLLNRYGSDRRNMPGAMEMPLLCATDSKENVLFVDSELSRFQYMDSRGVFRVIRGLTAEEPWDIIILNDKIFILHGDCDQSIQVYNIS